MRESPFELPARFCKPVQNRKDKHTYVSPIAADFMTILPNEDFFG
jgi:hypothetical protein